MHHYSDIKEALGVDVNRDEGQDSMAGRRNQGNLPRSPRAKGKGPSIGCVQPGASYAATGAKGKKGHLVMGIDPGPTESAFAIIRTDYTIVRAAKVPNREINIEDRYSSSLDGLRHVAIEGLACYGRPVGRETFETAYMVGRCCERADLAGVPYTIYARPVYANAIAGTGRVTDAVLYQALRLRFGGVKKGEPLFALKGQSDLRSAFAVAVYHLDCQNRTVRQWL